MEITRTKIGNALVVKLEGRLDAAWASSVERILVEAVRAGEHHVHVDMAEVRYVSSAGLRVLMATYKLLDGIHGEFLVCHPSKEVSSVLELSGLSRLFSRKASVPQEVAHDLFSSSSAAWEAFPLEGGSAMKWRTIGESSIWNASPPQEEAFPATRLGFGIGSLATAADDAALYSGEFLAIAGCVAHLATGGATRPDFLIAEENLVPSAWVTSGLVGEGAFAQMLRFEVLPDARTMGFYEIAQACHRRVGAAACAMACVAETTGLVGAALREPPPTGSENPFAFPKIRDRLLYTTERAFRDTTCLVVALIAQPGTPWDAWLRPLGPGLLGHAHAVAVPYRPFRKGTIPIAEMVHSLFEGENLLGMLHLINDQRIPNGTGESEFLRGACWIAPVTP